MNSSLTLSRDLGLRKAQMVGIAGLPSTDQAGLLATKRRWVLSRWRRNSGKASTLLSILAGSVSAVASCISGEEATSSGEGAASFVTASAARRHGVWPERPPRPGGRRARSAYF